MPRGLSLGLCRNCLLPVRTGTSFDMWIERWGNRWDWVKVHRQCNGMANHSKD